MARLRDHQPPENLEFIPGVALDPRDALGDPPGVIFDDDLEVGFAFAPPHRFEEEDWSDEEEEGWSDEEEDDVDSGYETLSEEDGDAEVNQRFVEEFWEEFWAHWRPRSPPAQAVEEVVRPANPNPQQRAESPSPPPSPIIEEEPRPSSPAAVPPAPSSTPASCPPPVGPALDFLPLGGSKRPRDEDEDEDPISKRPRPSSSEDSPHDPAPSTSAGTSLGFTRYFHIHRLLQDPESDDD